jgi:hypothetical protein
VSDICGGVWQHRFKQHLALAFEKLLRVVVGANTALGTWRGITMAFILRFADISGEPEQAAAGHGRFIVSGAVGDTPNQSKHEVATGVLERSPLSSRSGTEVTRRIWMEEWTVSFTSSE